MKGPELLSKGLIWNVGNGQGIRVWKDNWIPRSTWRPRTRLGPSIDDSLRVMDLICWESNEWDEEKVRQLLPHDDAIVVLGLRLVDIEVRDEGVWKGTRDGMFRVNFAYHLYMDQNMELKLLDLRMILRCENSRRNCGSYKCNRESGAFFGEHAAKCCLVSQT